MDLNTLLDTPPWDWPKDAAKILLKALNVKPSNERERLIAAELAGDIVVMNDQLAESLLEIVGSSGESEELRSKAATSLGAVLETASLNEFEDPDDVVVSEITFHYIQDLLHKYYLDESNSKEVRRRILEAAVRAPQDWQRSAISAAYSSGDQDWKLTAVFAMQWVPGFSDQIMEALQSTDPEIHCEAIIAAGGRELDAAWPHVVALVGDRTTPKLLLLAAIEAVGNIRPQEARDILTGLTESRDEEIAEAASEAIAMAQALSGEPDEEEEEQETDDGGKWIN